MNVTHLKKIIIQKLKPKDFGVFMLTVENFGNAGDDTLPTILELLNNIIVNINVVPSPGVNTSVASLV